MRLQFPVLISLALLVSICMPGCNSNPTIPDETQQVRIASSMQPHQFGGYYLLQLDTESNTVDVIPVRSAELHLNVTGVLNTTMGVSAVGVPSEADPVNGLFVMDITLTHPFATKPQLAGFDVKGILVAPGSEPFDGLIFPAGDETHLENADGYTRWWNPTEFTAPGMFGYEKGNLALGPTSSLTTTANGYKYFADALQANDSMSWVTGTALDADNGRGVFTAGSSNTRRYYIRFEMNPGPQVLYGYAIDASWNTPSPNPPTEIPDDFPMDANQPEPFNVHLSPRINTLFWDSVNLIGGGYLQMQVNVHDWQGQYAGDIASEIGAVQVWIPDLDPVVYTATFLNESSTKARYIVDFPVIVPTETGEYRVYCSVESTDGTTYQQTADPATAVTLKTYQLGTVEVQELPTCVIDTNNGFLDAVHLELTGGASGQVCKDDDIWDYYSFTIPPGQEASGDVTLYATDTDTTLYWFDPNLWEIMSEDIVDGKATLNMEDYSPVAGKYYLGIEADDTVVELYHIQINIDVTESPTDIIGPEVTPDTLFCQPQYVWTAADTAVFFGQYGLWTFDVTDTMNPVLLSSVLPAVYEDLDNATFYDHYLYYSVVELEGDSIRLFDLTDYANPIRFGSLLYIEDDIRNLAMNSEHLFVLLGETVNVYEWASTPESPTFVTTITLPDYCYRMEILDPEGPDTHLLTARAKYIYSTDVEDLQNVSPDGDYDLSAYNNMRDLKVRDNNIFLVLSGGSGGELVILEQAAATLDYVGEVTLGTEYLGYGLITLDYALVTSSNAGYYVVDITMLSTPTQVAVEILPILAGRMAVDFSGTKAFIILKDFGFEIDDVSSLPVIQDYSTNVATNAEYAAAMNVGGSDYLVVYDVPSQK